MSSESADAPVDSPELDDGSKYVLGPATYRKYARLETKPPDEHRTGGYERFRSYEDLETQPGGKRDVYEYHHRLLALLHPDVVEKPIDEAIEYIGAREVHHCDGVKWHNWIGNFRLETKSDHSGITQQEQLAYARDAKRSLEEEPAPGVERCDRCGAEEEELATSPGFEGRRCLECAIETADGSTINL